MTPEQVLHPTPKGLYCPPGDFYIDPSSRAERAVITHAHADHARTGHGEVWASRETLDIMALRSGAGFCRVAHATALTDMVAINGVSVGFWPAGHVLGSTQVLVEFGDLRLVVSGDYKRCPDPTCAPFQTVPLDKPVDVFITEATFALPVFRHPDDREEIAKLLQSVRLFPDRTHLIGVYALGKAQRLIGLLRQAGYDDTIYIHNTLQKICEYYSSRGIDLGKLATADLEESEKQFAGRIVLGPSSAFSDVWARRFINPVIGFASGWMQVRKRAKQSGVELPIILSDHCDWDGLVDTICEMQPTEVWITHGRDDALLRWCELNSIRARPLSQVGMAEPENMRR
jgi:putative mRNA 3-end processing factor